MKIRWALSCAACVLLLSVVGCKKDAEVEQFIKTNDELAAAIDGAKTADEANKLWADGKEGLKSKFGTIKEARGFQVSAEMAKKLETSLGDATTKICMKQIKGDDYKKLCDEYAAIFKD